MTKQTRPAAKAKKTTAKTATKKVVSKKPAPKKPSAKKAAPVKAATKKPVAKKPVAAKAAAAKKTAAQKTGARKPAAKTTPAKNPTAKSPTAKSPTAKSNVPENIKVMARAVEKALDANKAKDIVAVDLSRKSSLADFMIVASGNNSRQVAALARYAEEAMLKNGAKRCRVEGLPQGDWVIVDSGDVVVHVFRPEVREFYQLERLWADEPGTADSRRSLA